MTKDTVFHEVIAAAIPVLLLAAMVEQRHVAERPLLGRRLRRWLFITFAGQFLILCAVEIACLLQLAYQWPRLNPLASVPVALIAISTTLFYLGAVVTSDILDRSKDDEMRNAVTARWSDLQARAQKLREQVDRLAVEVSSNRDLAAMIELESARRGLATLDAELTATELSVKRLLEKMNPSKR